MNGEPFKIFSGVVQPGVGANLPGVRLVRGQYRVRLIEHGQELFTVCIPELAFDNELPELFLQRYPTFLRMSGLHVPAAVRRKGLARLLVMASLDCAQKVRLPVYLDVAPFDDRPMDFEPLFAFYESCGFRRFPGHPTAMVWEMPEMNRGGAEAQREEG